MKEKKDKITYSQFGFKSASKSNSNPESVEGFLDSVYETFLNDQKLDEDGLKARINKLKSETEQEKVKKNNLSAELQSELQIKESKEKEIEELEIEKIEVKNEDKDFDESSSLIPFVIGAFITILLTLYLFVFYSSSGYSAFYGVKPNSLGFINPDVFTDAQNKGGGVMAMIILFPVIFLGLGFLIHDSLEKNKIREKLKKKKSYITIISLLLITLIADAFIGYKISEGVHLNQFNRGEVNELWKFEMIYNDINFYLVLILGFVVYVIWGFLLHFVLSHSYLKSDSEKVKLLIENINNKIIEKKEDLLKIKGTIHRLESALENSIEKITQKEKDLIGYENGVIPVNIPLLRSSVGEFMGGFQSFTIGNKGESEETTLLINSVLKIQEKWLENKITNLATDN